MQIDQNSRQAYLCPLLGSLESGALDKGINLSRDDDLLVVTTM